MTHDPVHPQDATVPVPDRPDTIDNAPVPEVPEPEVREPEVPASEVPAPDARQPEASGPDGRKPRRRKGRKPTHKPAVVQGPTIRREHQVQGSTMDQRLLDNDGDTGWLHADPWRVMRIQAEFVDGFGALAEIGPAVSIFGSARTPKGHPMYTAAQQLARELVRHGQAVITGGGPGIMEAANKGARKAGGTSVGLGIELPFESALNQYVNLGINFRYFFARKVMFLKYSQGFIVMPGGYGTFDEMFEALTLAQTGKVHSFPIVLFGSEYWGGLVEWVRARVLDGGYVSPADLDRFLVTDSIDEAIAHVLGSGRDAAPDTPPGPN